MSMVIKLSPLLLMTEIQIESALGISQQLAKFFSEGFQTPIYHDSPKLFQTYTFFWIERQGSIVCACSINLDAQKNMFLENVLTDTFSRRLGLAYRLISHILQQFQFPILFLQVSCKSGIVDLYKKLGFKIVQTCKQIHLMYVVKCIQ